MQYHFDQLTILMNYFNDEMKNEICPNDSRFRKDIRCLEEGHIDEAEAEKVKIENK